MQTALKAVLTLVYSSSSAVFTYIWRERVSQRMKSVFSSNYDIQSAVWPTHRLLCLSIVNYWNISLRRLSSGAVIHQKRTPAENISTEHCMYIQCSLSATRWTDRCSYEGIQARIWSWRELSHGQNNPVCICVANQLPRQLSVTSKNKPALLCTDMASLLFKKQYYVGQKQK